MSGLTWLGDAFALRVAATLLHFVWQGLILTIVAVVISSLLRHASARTRYSVNVGTLLLMVACLPVTFALQGTSLDGMSGAKSESGVGSETHATETSPPAGNMIDSIAPSPDVSELGSDQLVVRAETLHDSPASLSHETSAVTVASRGGASSDDEVLAAFASLAPFVAWAYFAGVLLMMARLSIGLWGGRSLRRLSNPMEDAGLLGMVQQQAVRVGLKCAPAVAFCERISVPIVIGIVRPMILLPGTLISGLSPDQLQALVTHELSHIRRYDLVVNLLQRVVEAVLFFHPAVWFISRQISMERENVADDAVLAAGWPAVRYADALVRMAELSSSLRSPGVAVDIVALAASGNTPSEFKRRVVRLLDGPSSSQLRLSGTGFLAMMLIAASLLMTPFVVRLSAGDSQVESAEASGPDDSDAPTAADEVAEDQSPDAEPTAQAQTAEPPRIVKGFVTGPSGAIAGAKATVTLSLVDDDTKAFYGLPVGKPVKILEYTTDENGRYEIEIPFDLAMDPLARVTVKLSHSNYLDRQIGPVPVSDFDGKRIGNGQPYWMGRQMAQQAIKQSRLRKANQLTGRILLPDGTPAVGAKVKTATKYRAYSWKHHSPDDYGASDEAFTDSAGKFSIETDESASFTAMMPGQAPLIVDDLAKRIQLANGDAPNDFRLPAANRIKGRVLTAAGKPAPRAIVTVKREFKWNEFDMPLSFSTSCAADELGYYELPPLPADKYTVIVAAQLGPNGDAAAYNKVMATRTSRFVLGSTPGLESQPLDLVFVQQSVTLKSLSPFTTLDLQASPMVTLKVNVQFPDGTPDPNRQTDVGISGTINGQEWNGQYAKADENGVATLRAPKGLERAFIKTGLAKHRRSSESEIEIGKAIHFRQLDKDISGVTVIKPEFAKLEVDVTLTGDASSSGVGLSGRVSISASYVRKGFAEQSSDRQKIGLTGATQTGQADYQATALPDEPILLTISLSQDGDRRTIHEEQLTLVPGEKRLRKISIRNGKVDTRGEELQAARDRAIDFLLKQQRADGSWTGDTEGRGYAAGTTAMIGLTLFESGVKSDEAVQKAMQFLLKASPSMTKEIALQTMFLHTLGKSGAALRRRNLQWLIESQIKEGSDAGGWGYQRDPVGARADGANSAYAILALTTVASRIESNPDAIPDEVWQRSLDWLLSMQRQDGSWGYTSRGGQTSGTMTACGLAGLKGLKERVEANPKVDHAIQKAESWLKANWDTKANPNGSAWPLFYLEWACRALRNKPLLGERDWYPEVLRTVLQGQQSDGSISHSSSKASPIITTAFALEILRSRPVEELSR